jgi:hypothetical protein
VTSETIGETSLIDAISSILIVYSWVVAASLVFFLFLIARFYEIRFGQKSYYQLFLIPFFFFVIGAVADAFLANHYTGNPLLDFVGHIWSDLFLLGGGVVLIILCYALSKTMMGGRG